MKRIAILTPGFLPVPSVKGGAIEEIITKVINKNEVESNYKIDLFTKVDSDIDKIKLKNTQIYQIDKNAISGFIDKCINKIHLTRFHDFKFNKIYNILKRSNYDYIIVENNFFMYEYIYKKISKKTKNIKFIFHLHNDFGNAGKSNELMEYITKTAYKIITVSDFLKKRIEKMFICDNVEVLYNTIDMKKFYPSGEHKVNKTLKFLYCGRIDEEKGLKFLTDAFVEVLDEGYEAELDIIGRAYFDFEYERKILEKISKYNNIELIGRILNKDVPNYIRKADVVVIPTISEEAFGMTLLEAMACGKCAIITNSGGMLELADSEGTIVVKKEENLKENLKGEIINLIKKPDSIVEMGRNNCKKIIQSNKFDDENYFDNFFKIVDK